MSSFAALARDRVIALRTYALWSVWPTLAFFSVYPLCNWLTSLRPVTYGLYVPHELRIPFVPGFVWVYLSMYLLFLMPALVLDPRALRALAKRLVLATLACGLVFLLVPSRLGFPREVPADPLQAAVFRHLFSVDLPHNMAPSLHVVWSTLFLASLAEASRSRLAKASWWTWLALISASTVLVHQHHLLDVASGLGLAVVLHGRTFRKG